MRLPGEEESGGTGLPVFYMIVGVSAFILILLLVLLKSNSGKNSGSDYIKELQKQQEEALLAAQEEEEALSKETGSKLRAQDLDFWDMYPVDEEPVEAAAADKTSSTGQSNKPDFTQKAEEDREEQQQKAQEVLDDPATDGKHTLVTTPDGKEEWVLISPYLEKNTYDFTNMEEKAGLKHYMENGKEISYVGVDISKQTGSISFIGLKAAGVDYVMIRLGARGYSSGQISVDEKFKENIEGAIAAGLDVGIYFYSQAINQDEAVQEASIVVQNLEPYKGNIKYPVAFDMEFVANDAARIDGLSRDDRTTIATAFLETVRAAGYIPMIYGDKEWLIKEIDLAKLQNYDVWLSQDADIPDYPYRYAMWQYTTTGTVNGIQGDADLDICFIGYSQR